MRSLLSPTRLYYFYFFYFFIQLKSFCGVFFPGYYFLDCIQHLFFKLFFPTALLLKRNKLIQDFPTEDERKTVQSAVEEDKKVRSSKEEEMLLGRFLMHLSIFSIFVWPSGVPVPLCHYLTLSISVVFQAVPIGCGTLDNIVICDLGNPLPAGEMVGMKSLETGVCLLLIHPYVAFFCVYIYYICVFLSLRDVMFLSKPVERFPWWKSAPMKDHLSVKTAICSPKTFPCIRRRKKIKQGWPTSSILKQNPNI